MKKRIFLVCLVCFILCILPFALSAEEGQTINVTNQQELIAALNMSSPVANINITQGFGVSENCSVLFDNAHIANYSNVVVTVMQNVTINIDNGGVLGCFWPSFEGKWSDPLKPNGKFINNGTIVVNNGGKISAEFTRNNGTLIVKNGGESVCCSDNYGTVIVESGGSYRTSQGQQVNNHGTVTIQNGAELETRFGSEFLNRNDGTLNLDGAFYCGAFNNGNEQNLWFENDGTVNGHGDIIIYDDNPDNPIDFDAMIENVMGKIGQTKRFNKWDDINIFKQVEVSSYEELAAAFPGNRTVAGENIFGDMDVIVVLNADITIPKNGEIDTMGTIIIPEGLTLTVSEGGTVQAGIRNNGTVDVKDGGKLSTTMGNNIVNNNVLNVEPGGEIRSQMGGQVINNATCNLDGDFYCGAIKYGNEQGVWFDNTGTVDGNGKIILYNADPESPVDMEDLATDVQNILGTQNVPSVLPTYSVIWKSQDGNTVLESDEDVVSGSKPDYNGNAPVKSSDNTYNYTFIGWALTANSETGTEESKLSAVSGNITYYAAFKKTAKAVDPTPTPTPTPTPKPTATPTPKPTATPTPKPTATPTPKPTATPTPKPTATPTPKPTATATPEPTVTATPEPTVTATPEPTATPTPEPTVTATPEPTATTEATNAPTTDPSDKSESSSGLKYVVIGSAVVLVLAIVVVAVIILKKKRK